MLDYSYHGDHNTDLRNTSKPLRSELPRAPAPGPAGRALLRAALVEADENADGSVGEERGAASAASTAALFTRMTAVAPHLPGAPMLPNPFLTPDQAGPYC